MTYKILEINKDQKWIKIEVVFDDGEKHTKRMMAPVESEEAIHGAIKQWLADYLPERERESKYNPQSLKGVKHTFTLDDLPKSLKEINAETAIEDARIKEEQLRQKKEDSVS